MEHFTNANEEVSEFKGAIPMPETKAKRDEFLVEIRKKKNRSLVQQIRRKYFRNEIEEIIPVLEVHTNAFVQTSFQQNLYDNDVLQQFQAQTTQLCQEFFNILNTMQYDELLPVVKAIRELIGSKAIPDSGRIIINTGVVPHLISLLGPNLYPLKQIQAEIAWLLANISAGNSQDTGYLVDQGVLDTLANSLRNCDNDELHENAMWTLANISGEADLAYRDAVLDIDVLNLVVRKLCTTPKKTSYYRTAAWLISNLVRGTPYPSYDKIVKTFAALNHLFDYQDQLILQHTLLSLAYLSEDNKEVNLKSILENNLVPKFIPYITNENETLCINALKTAGNLAKGNKRYSTNLFDPEVFKAIPYVLSHKNRDIRREACVTLNNIFTNEFDDHDYVLEHNIVPLLITIAREEQEDDMKALATSCIYNFIYDCKLDEAKVTIEAGFVDVILVNLGSFNSRLVENSLQALYRIFMHGESMKKDFNGFNPITYRIAEQNCLPIIENLLNHQDNNISSQVSVLLDNFFKSG